MPLVRAASLNGYPELAAALGLDARAILRRHGLSLKALADPEAPISMIAVRDILETSAKAAGVEDFGVRLASNRRLSNLGPISLVMREEPTARQALDTLCRYLRLLNASLLTRVEDQGDTVTIREQFLIGRPGSTSQSMQLAVGVMFRMLSELLGPGWTARRALFVHRAPADLRAHRALFGSTISFDAPFNGIVCARRDLERALPDTDPGRALFAKRYLEQQLVRNRPDTSDQVRRLIAALLPGGRCTAERLAQHLGVDRRTIHRRLQAEGTSFAILLRTVRGELAVRQLRDSDAPITEVADLLGFADASSLAHWFRGQFGSSISQWRARSGEHV